MKKEREAKYYISILNCIHNPVAVVNRNMTLGFMNEAFRSFIILNLNNHTILEDRPIGDYFPESLETLVNDIVSVLKEGEMYQNKLVLMQQNIEIFYDYVIFPVYQGSVVQECSIIIRNITDIELKKRELGHQIQFLSGLVKRLPIGVFIFDILNGDQKITLWNPKMNEYFGRSEEELLGHDYQGIFDPETYGRHQIAIEQVLSVGLYYEFPAELIKTEKSSKYYHTIISPLNWHNGKAESLLVIMEDIDQKIAQDLRLKRYQKKLMSVLKSKSQLLNDKTAEISSILENSYGVSIFSLDKNFCYRVFNAHFSIQTQVQFGINIEKGKSFFDILGFFSDEGKHIEQILKQTLNGKSTTTELSYYHPDNGTGFIDAVFSPLYSQGVVIGTTVIFIDTTSTRRLKKEAEVFKSVADLAEYGVLLADPNLNIIYMNNYWKSTFPSKENSRDQKHLSSFFSAKDILELEVILKEKDTRNYYMQRELHILDMNEKAITLLMNSVRFEGLEGEIGGIALTCLDITPINEAKVAMKISKERAERTSLLKSAFVANMSHEIRTPLNAILGFATLLKNNIEEGQLKRHADSILSSGIILKDLINNVLDFSKIEAGKMILHDESTEITPFFNDIFQLFSLQALEKKVFLEFRSLNKIPLVLDFDALRLRQVLINLLGNALKFIYRGHIRLLLKYNPLEKILIISISDTGIGISESEQPYIFNPFEQNDQQDSRQYEGTGLGLAITEKIIQLMKGRIKLVSSEGHGSTFTIKIPVGITGNIDKNEKVFFFTKEGLPVSERLCYVDKNFISDKLIKAGIAGKINFIPYEISNITQKESGNSIYAVLSRTLFNPSDFKSCLNLKIITSEEMSSMSQDQRNKAIHESLEVNSIVSVLNSLFWQNDNLFEDDFSVELLSSDQLSFLVKAVESKNFSDIEQSVPIIKKCGTIGVKYADILVSALASFDILTINNTLDKIMMAFK